MEKKLKLEEQIRRLEEIVESLDEGENSLDEHLKEYEEGMKLSSSIRKYLDEKQQKIVDITEKYQK